MNDIKFTTRCVVIPSATFKWKIENFGSCRCTAGEYITTPTFETHIGNWMLLLYPYGKDTLNRGVVAFYLQKNSSQPPANDMTFDMSIQDKHGMLQYTSIHRHLFKHMHVSGCDSFIDSQILLGERRDELLPEGNLTVVCKIALNNSEIPHYFVTATDEYKCKDTKGPDYVSQLETMSDEFEKIYLSCEKSDLILTSDDQLFKAHKAVLAARSPAFEVLFRNDTTESQNDAVEVPDIPATLLPDVLRYMYTGKSKGLSRDKATELYKIAEKYGMSGLQSICRRVLFHPLSMTNFCLAVSIAYNSSDTQLKKELLEFLIEHPWKVLLSLEWNNFKITHKTLAVSLLQDALLKTPT